MDQPVYLKKITSIQGRGYLLPKNLVFGAFTGFLSYKSDYKNLNYENFLGLNKSFTRSFEILSTRLPKVFEVNAICYIEKNL